MLGANRLRELRATAPGFVPSNPPESRTRVNDSTGYQVTWRERRGGRTIYARDIWLVVARARLARGASRAAAHDARGGHARTRTAPAARGRSSSRCAVCDSVRSGSAAGDREITFDDFLAVDMRVGRIVAVEDFPEARRPAWKLRIDFGPEIGEKRSSAQITNYAREELEGRLVVGVVNFPPRQIGPVRSEVLVLGRRERRASGAAARARRRQRARRPDRLRTALWSRATSARSASAGTRLDSHRCSRSTSQYRRGSRGRAHGRVLVLSVRVTRDGAARSAGSFRSTRLAGSPVPE